MYSNRNVSLFLSIKFLFGIVYQLCKLDFYGGISFSSFFFFQFQVEDPARWIYLELGKVLTAYLRRQFSIEFHTLSDSFKVLISGPRPTRRQERGGQEKSPRYTFFLSSSKFDLR